MALRSSQDDSLSFVGLVMLLEESGLELTETQLERLKPHLISPCSVTWSHGSLRTKGTAIAHASHYALAIDASTGHLAVGERNESELTSVELFRSTELAIRVFLSRVTGKDGI
jgi:hypothetical protein